MPLRIPERLADLLSRDPEIAASVCASLNAFEPWLDCSRTPLFPEYTDHGPGHLNGVLSACEFLISSQSWLHLTSSDSAALILSVLLHDCAMHLTKDGFLSLVSDSGNVQPNPEFGDRLWSDLWREYQAEIVASDEHTIRRIFGKSLVRRRHRLLMADSWDEESYLLAGEFVRRHHPRLAHQIALGAVPGPPHPDPIRLDDSLPKDLRRLVGIIARSHGFPLREGVENAARLASTNFRSDRQWARSHPTFLMAILRIADYLQISDERAPSALNKVRTLRVPFSQREWATHQAVKELHQYGDDEEALHARTELPSVDVFLKLEKLQTAIQAELDTSWAVLGETYSRTPTHFGLSIRRVYLDLGNHEHQGSNSSLPFVPVAAGLSTSPDMLPLLVEPLYGSKHELAIREAVQNAVDAVYLRRAWDLSDSVTPDDRLQGADVRIFSENSTLYVIDRGIGMTPDTVSRFFLRAGAKFRDSESFSQLQARSPLETFMRSGRFGIGALTYFLIAKEVIVTTRHISMSRAIRFRVSLSSDNIELLWVDGPIGTSIELQLTEYGAKVVESLKVSVPKEALYHLSDPAVSYFGKQRPSHQRLPNRFDETIGLPWRRSRCGFYESVDWSYSGMVGLYVNGFYVLGLSSGKGWHLYLDWRVPHLDPPATLSIFDPEGKVPLSLDRLDLSGKLKLGWAFQRDLSLTILKDLIAQYRHSLCWSPAGLLTISKPWKLIGAKGIPRLVPILFGDQGCMPLSAHALEKTGQERAIGLFAGEGGLSNALALAYKASETGHTTFVVHSSLGWDVLRPIEDLLGLSLECAYIPKSRSQEALYLNDVNDDAQFEVTEDKSGIWCFRVGADRWRTLVHLLGTGDLKVPVCIASFKVCVAKAPALDSSLLVEAWRDLGSPWLPKSIASNDTEV